MVVITIVMAPITIKASWIKIVIYTRNPDHPPSLRPELN